MCVWLASVCGAHIFRYKRTPRHWHWCWHRHAHNNHTLFCYRHSTADNDDTRYTLMCENLYRLVKPVSILYTLCAVFLCFSWYTSHNMYLFVCSFAYFFFVHLWTVFNVRQHATFRSSSPYCLLRSLSNIFAFRSNVISRLARASPLAYFFLVRSPLHPFHLFVCAFECCNQCMWRWRWRLNTLCRLPFNGIVCFFFPFSFGVFLS